MKAVTGNVKHVYAPNFGGFLKAVFPPLGFFNGAIWTIEFVCGNCDIKVSVQHDEDKSYHKCPVCKTINKLNRVSP